MPRLEDNTSTRALTGARKRTHSCTHRRTQMHALVHSQAHPNAHAHAHAHACICTRTSTRTRMRTHMHKPFSGLPDLSGPRFSPAWAQNLSGTISNLVWLSPGLARASSGPLGPSRRRLGPFWTFSGVTGLSRLQEKAFAVPYQCLTNALPVPYSVPYPVPYLACYGVWHCGAFKKKQKSSKF